MKVANVILSITSSFCPAWLASPIGAPCCNSEARSHEYLLFERPLLASSAQINFGAQNAAQSAASSSAQTSDAAASISPSSSPVQLDSTSHTFLSHPASLAPATLSLPRLSPASQPAVISAPAGAPPASGASVFPPPGLSGSALAVPPNEMPGAAPLPAALRESMPTPAENNSVESFFQLNRLNTQPMHEPVSLKTVLPQIKESHTSNERTSWLGKTGRVVWHVLDNAGVPMLFGRNDADLDPSIARTFETSPKITTETKAVKLDVDNDRHTELVPKPSEPQAIHGKIPESELEGTTYDFPPATIDAQTETQ